ncbi:hypothetical protein PIB30_035298 [Stylosanthes scabra]|uniref:Ubiquitin-like protease family profile domain-containing protein n=1 Tax=Stylosanthes scabra TaxID=79078 RepID=A0ABU6ZC64_9FABA|nr:hypothetical protein [Stylosanthes scabra]
MQLFAPVLFFEHWWLYVLDVVEKELFVLDSKNIESPGDERTDVNHFAPNEHDCGVYIMKWMELIDPTVLKECSSSNKEYNIETWTEPKLDEFRKDIVAKIMLSESNA